MAVRALPVISGGEFPVFPVRWTLAPGANPAVTILERITRVFGKRMEREFL